MRKSEMGVEEMLERWGLRVVGGTLKSPLKVSTGGDPGIDDDLILVRFIESTEGFERAAPVLRHVYCDGLDPIIFRMQRPGEQRSRALIRLGWFDLNFIRDREIPDRVLEEFRTTLERRISEIRVTA